MQKINARDCIIKELNSTIYKKFVNKNHKQGYAVATKIYGLFYSNSLIQLMSFGKPRFNKNYQWEIIRECTKKEYTVRGGTSKLWKHFLKNNSVRSCICYSYPHNGEFTEHYIRYCDFKNIKKAKPEKKIYFEGQWNNQQKRIDKSILEKHGVDRLLKTKQGQDRTNEQILLDLGFNKKYEEGYSPQVDIYYPFGILYRIDDRTDGCFYIGMTERQEDWENDVYNGSGKKWLHHMNAHPDHIYERTILKQNFRTPKDLRDAEYKEIKKYVIHYEGQKIIEAVDGLMNLKLRTQGQHYVTAICSECGGKGGRHRKNCSHATKCKECGGINWQHKVGCSKANPCPECGVIRGHKKTCSHYKRPKPCSECGTINGHSKECSKSKHCSECGMTQGKHREYCSKFKICSECGGKNGSHYKTCSKYVEGKHCPECGAIRKHKKDCSKYTPDKKEIQVCKECGAKGGNHKKNCSRYIDRTKNVKACSECGKKFGHYKTCSKYKVPKSCPECGKRYGHYSTCSKFKFERKKRPCAECGAIVGHKKFCSQVIKCKECGGTNGRHKKQCSKNS